MTMSIEQVNTSLNNAFSPLSVNNAIKLLEKQKLQLQEQIQKVNESKMDEKAKQEKVKSLQDQIEQIDTVIQQRRAEKLSQGLNKNQSASDNSSNAGSGSAGGDAPGMTRLLQANATYSQVKVLERTNNNLKGKISGLRTEIKLDEARGCDTKAKRKELRDSEYRDSILGRNAGETLNSVRRQIRETAGGESDDTRTISLEDDNDQSTIPVNNTNEKNTVRNKPGRVNRNREKIDIRA
jgi:hypothetical protein